MSWSDPCGNCGQHRADCECDNYSTDNQQNEISIVIPEERLYTKEEVLAMCKQSYNLRTIDEDVRSTKSFEEWFNRNLND